MSLCHLKTDPDLRHGYKAKHGVAEEPEFRRPPEIETLRAWSQLVVPDGPNRGKTKLDRNGWPRHAIEE